MDIIIRYAPHPDQRTLIRIEKGISVRIHTRKQRNQFYIIVYIVSILISPDFYTISFCLYNI